MKKMLKEINPRFLPWISISPVEPKFDLRQDDTGPINIIGSELGICERRRGRGGAKQ
jgi:hypothetical protein